MSAYNPVKARTRLLARYGLKPEDYARLFLAQDGRCAICFQKPSGKRMLDIDHNHKTMAIRGLLCHRHNRGLGYFQTSAQLKIAGAYFDATTGYVVPKKRRTRRAGINGGIRSMSQSRRRGST